MNDRTRFAGRLLAASALLAISIAATPNQGRLPFPKLTAVTSLWTSHEGYFTGGYYSTANGAEASRLYFENESGQPISGPGDTETAISVTLKPGDTLLKFRAEGWSLVPFYTFSLFFNGESVNPGLSYQYDSLWDAVLGPNPSEALMGNDDMFPLVPGNMNKSFVVDGWRITVSDIHVTAADDMVGPMERIPNGGFDIVGSFIVHVQPAGAAN